MNPETKIDLAYFLNPNSNGRVDWTYGHRRALAMPMKHLAFTLECLLNETDAEWILFWDYNIGEPDVELIKQLTTKKVDVWHGGLNLGQGAEPEVLNNCDPAWMYSVDAPANVTQTSFRLSLRGCLIKTSVLKHVGALSTHYDTLSMTGLALGYKVMRAGGIIRYHADFVKGNHEKVDQITRRDEWIFMREFYNKKWQLWTILNRSNKVANYKMWRNTKYIKNVGLTHSIHSSLKQVNAIIPETTISILAPTLHRYTYLINELEQLDAQTVKSYEILVTDQSDKDNRIQIDFSQYKNLNVRYFPQDEKGQCIAWNKLMEEATGEYLLFLDDDIDGIKPDFVEKMLLTASEMDCDMVASNVVELGINYDNINHHYGIASTFPITLIKRSILLKSGFMDMFFNKNIRADHDLAMRCHLSGALMVYDPTALVHHHRAPAGGLRTHKARVVTNYMAKNSISKFINPTSSEIYLAKKYFTDIQVRNFVRIKYLNQLTINGNIIKRLLKLIIFVIKLPILYRGYKRHERLANEGLVKNNSSPSKSETS